MREVNQAWAILGDAERRGRSTTSATRPRSRRWSTRPARRGRRGGLVPGDTAWMDDFASWRDERDDLLGPDDFDGPARPVRMVLPVVLLGAGIVLGCLALVVNWIWMFAVAGIVLGCSLISFFMLPLLLMTRRDSR